MSVIKIGGTINAVTRVATAELCSLQKPESCNKTKSVSGILCYVSITNNGAVPGSIESIGMSTVGRKKWLG